MYTLLSLGTDGIDIHLFCAILTMSVTSVCCEFIASRQSTPSTVPEWTCGLLISVRQYIIIINICSENKTDTMKREKSINVELLILWTFFTCLHAMQYSTHPLIRTRKGPGILFELTNVRIIGNLEIQGKPKILI